MTNLQHPYWASSHHISLVTSIHTWNNSEPETLKSLTRTQLHPAHLSGTQNLIELGLLFQGGKLGRRLLWNKHCCFITVSHVECQNKGNGDIFPGYAVVAQQVVITLRLHGLSTEMEPSQLHYFWAQPIYPRCGRTGTKDWKLNEINHPVTNSDFKS